MKNNTWKCLFQWNQALNSGRDGSWPNAFDIQPLIAKNFVLLLWKQMGSERQMKANKSSAGIDGIDLKFYESNLERIYTSFGTA